MRFVTSLVHSVENINTASDFFCTVLGFFPAQNHDNYGFLLENGAVSIRLMSSANLVQNALQLELPSQRLEDDVQALLGCSDLRVLSENLQINPYRLETRLQAPHGLILILFKTLTEDDLGVLPDLPISLEWETPALTCVQQLLTYVPLDFRQLARTQITERAEELTAEQGEITVLLNTAVQALAEVTPHFQHPTLVAALRERGIDPLHYFHTSPL